MGIKQFKCPLCDNILPSLVKATHIAANWEAISYLPIINDIEVSLFSPFPMLLRPKKHIGVLNGKQSKRCIALSAIDSKILITLLIESLVFSLVPFIAAGTLFWF